MTTDGYVIQWLRSAIPSNTLAVLYGLALDCIERRVLGPGYVEIELIALDETKHAHPPGADRAAVSAPIGDSSASSGVQSKPVSARPWTIARAAARRGGRRFCIGGFHVSGCLSMLPEAAGGAQIGHGSGHLALCWRGRGGGSTRVLRERVGRPAQAPSIITWRSCRGLAGVAGRRVAGRRPASKAHQGRPPYQLRCRARLARSSGSFCTIINVQGRQSRRPPLPRTSSRSSGATWRRAINRFFITDDNFARKPRLGEHLRPPDRAPRGRDSQYQIHHPGGHHCATGSRNFIEKAGGARGVTRVFNRPSRASIPIASLGAKKRPRTRSPNTARCWLGPGKAVGRHHLRGLHPGLPDGTRRDSILAGTSASSSASCRSISWSSSA